MLAIGLAALVFLGYRVVTLEQRLDAISAQLGAPSPGSAGDAPKSGTAQAAAGPAKPPAAQGHEQRLALLEKDVSSLRSDVRSLEKATETTLAEATPDPKQILSVVGSEASRIRDRQLEFHSAHWLKWRRDTLNQFAVEQQLSEEQTSELDELLTAEIGRFVELLRRDDLADKPEQLAADAATALRDTDNAVRGVLDNEQFAAWARARVIERKILWPWLPD